MSSLIKYIFPLIWLLLLAGCKNCDKEDPCPSTRRTNANFFVYEWDVNTNQQIVGGGEFFRKYWEPPMDTDTTCTNWVEFVAEDQNAVRYEWIIGLDTFTTRSVSLGGFHNSDPFGKKLTVSLKTWKKPDRNCFGEDSGYAEHRRTIVSYSYKGSLLTERNYFITLNNGDTSTLSFRFYPYPRSDVGTHGITSDQDTVYGFDFSVGYKKLAMIIDILPKDSIRPKFYGQQIISAMVSNKDYQRISGIYETIPKTGQRKKGTFIGIRK